MDEQEIRENAFDFVKNNRKRIAKELTDLDKYKPDRVPISVFMAGSPGAGKTEFSKNLIAILEEDKERRAIRIDGDEIRSLIPGYTGSNSYLFQGAVSLVVEKIHDFVLSNKQTFVLDGTFSKYEKAVSNIQRSLNKNRLVLIFYVYQKPEVAWRFTKEREHSEGRNIPKEAFVEQFFGAKDTINRILKKFKREVVVFLVKKDFERDEVGGIIEIKEGETTIDNCIKDVYTKEELKKIL